MASSVVRRKWFNWPGYGPPVVPVVPAVPVIEQFSGGSAQANTTAHTVTYPGGQPAAGKLLIALFGFDDNPVLNALAGWNDLILPGSIIATRLYARYKIAGAAEGLTAPFTTPINAGSTWQCYVISGFTGVPEAAYGAQNTVAAMDPPPITPSWGAKPTLYIAAGANDGTVTTTVYPAGYTGGRKDMWNNIEGCGISSAVKSLMAGGTENPGAFTLSGGEQWEAGTIAVQGVS